MAPASAGIAENLFLLYGSSQVVKPFGIGELRQNFRRWGQEFRIGHPLQHNFVKRAGSFNPNCIALMRLIFQWPRNSERVPPGFQFGKFIPPLAVAIYGGSDRILMRNELHGYSFQ